ncbi:ZIP family metal transporter [Candidatus Peregrinibacteria bacterium]|nr:ZIP family metal transporter [Candidatus Peregrinibacteria bacterium]
MLSPAFLSIGSVALVSLASLVGLFFVGLRDRWMKRRLFFLISFAVGGIIGDVFVHILPKMIEGEGVFFPTASFMIAIGILLSFMLEKGIHWHHCHMVDCPIRPRSFGTVSLVGDAAHNFADGLLIAGSYLVDMQTGIATTVAVLLHEIPQEIGDYAVLLYSGYSRSRALFLNFVTALTAVTGAAFALSLRASLPNMEHYLLPLVAGNFLYIAIADLLPELHKQTDLRHSLLQIAGVTAGIGIMLGLTLLE